MSDLPTHVDETPLFGLTDTKSPHTMIMYGPREMFFGRVRRLITSYSPMRCEIKGIYPVEADESCHLVEVIITDRAGSVDMMQSTQVIPDQPRANWQVSWDERMLDDQGSKDVGGRSPRKIIADDRPVRLAFFMHLLDPARPLMTPAGPVVLPRAQPQPKRLSFLQYETPG